MRAAVAVAVAALTVTLGGCGGSSLGEGAASSAGVLKPGALVYWQTVSDPDSEQWDQAEELLRKFPDGERWIAELKEEIENEGVNWETDVEPALGSVVDVAVYFRAGNEPAVVGLTNPDDKEKLLALVEKLNAKSDEPAVTRVVGDWVAISDSQQSIDAALKKDGGQALEDSDAFTSADEELPDDAVSWVYVDPARAIELAPGEERDALGMLGLDELDFAGAWAKAKDDGAEMAFALRGAGADKLLGTGEPYASRLLEQVPDDAFAFVTFQGGGLRGQLQELRDNPLFAAGLREFEEETGINVDEVLALLEGEVALYIRPGVPIPEFTLLLDSANPAAARDSLERILRLAAERLGGEVRESGDVVTARFEDFNLALGTTEGAVVLSTSTNVFTRSMADKLGDSERFTSALEAAGTPDEYTGLTYIDVNKTWEVIESYLGFADEGDEVPPEVRRNLEPVRSLVSYGSEDGTLSTYLAFLEIE